MSETFLSLGADARGLLEALRSSTQALTQASNTMLGMAANLETVQSELDQTKVKLAQAAAVAKEVSLTYAGLSKAIYSGGKAATFARESLDELTIQSKQAVAALGALAWIQERQLRNAQVNIGVTQAANAEFQKQVGILAEVAALRNTTIQQIRAETQAVAVRNAATIETNSLYKQLQAAQVEAVSLSSANVQAMMREVAAQKALNAERRASILYTVTHAEGSVGITTDPRLTVGTHTKDSAAELASLNAHYAKLEKATHGAAAVAKELSLTYAGLSKAIYSGGEAATFARKSLNDLTIQSKQAVAALGALAWSQERQLRNAQVNIGVTQAANAEFQKQVSILAEAAALRNTTIQQIRAETQAVAVRNAATLETNSLYKQLQAAQAEAVALSNTNVQAMMREVAAQKALNAERRASILHTGAYAGGPVGITTDPRLIVGTHTEESASKLASLNADYAKLERGTRAATKETGKFKDALGQLRATARGTSGALGGLWLTYAQTAGQMTTMVAAFTAASAAVASVRFGAQMGRELAFIQGASEESAEAIAHVNQQILSMASTDSLQGPRELANGLRILVQAGFDTRESLSMLRPLMELTVGGEIDIAKGADTLQKTIHAFNLSVADAPTVVDQLGKAAAISATNVEEMSSALTSAASIGKLYGQNLTDTLTMLGILSSGGIKGSAAGTALTNMMRELDGRTEEARLTLKALNIEVADSTGAWKPALDVIKEMTVKLKELSPKAFADFVEMSQNLRGARSFAVIADALRRATDEATNMGEAIKNAEGFMGRLYELVSKTTSGEFDQFTASLEAALVTAFQQSEPAIRDVVASLKDLARSPEFREFLKTSIEGLASMVGFLTEWGDAIAALGVGLVASKVLWWLGELALTLTAAKKAQDLFNVAALRNPYLLLGAAAVGAGAWLGKQYVESQQPEPTAAPTKADIEALQREVDASRARVSALEAIKAGTADFSDKTVLSLMSRVEDGVISLASERRNLDRLKVQLYQELSSRDRAVIAGTTEADWENLMRGRSNPERDYFGLGPNTLGGMPVPNGISETHGTKTLADMGILSEKERSQAEKRLRAELDAAVRWYDIQRKAIEKREARLEESSKFELSLLDANLQAQLMSVEEFDAKKRAIERKNLTDHILNVKAQQLLLEQELPKAKAFAEKYPTSSQAKSRVDKLIAEQEQLTGEIERAHRELKLFDETSKSLDIAKFLELRKALADVVTEGIRAREAIDFEASLATLDDGTADYLRTLEELRVAHEEELAAIVASNEQVAARVLIENKAYQDAVENAKYAEAEKLRLQGDWVAGATKGLNQYRAEIKDTFSVARDVAYQTFKQLEDGMVEMLTDWENGFRSFGETLKNIFQMIWAEVNRVMIVRPLIGAILGTGTTATGVSAATGAQGGGFSPAGLGNLFSGTGWGGLQANLSATLLDTFGMEGASQWVMDANPGMLGSGLAGLGTFAMGLLSGQNAGQSATAGIGAFLGGLTPLGPIGSALGGMLGNWIGGSLFGDDLQRGYLGTGYRYDYVPGSGFTQVGSAEWREDRNGEDFRESSSEISSGVLSGLNTITSSFMGLMDQLGLGSRYTDYLSAFGAQAGGSRSYVNDPRIVEAMYGPGGLSAWTGGTIDLNAFISGEDEAELRRSGENILDAAAQMIFAPLVEGSAALLQEGFGDLTENLDLSMFTDTAAATLGEGLTEALNLMQIGEVTSFEELQKELDDLGMGVEQAQYILDYVQQVADVLGGISDAVDAVGLSSAEREFRGIFKTIDEYARELEALGINISKTALADLKSAQIGEFFRSITEGIVAYYGPLEQAGDSLVERYRAQRENAEQLAAAFDGTVDATVALDEALGALHNLELEMLSSIKSALATVNTTFGGSIESIRLDLMEPGEQYDYYKSRAERLASATQRMTDPEQIKDAIGEINSYAMSAWGLLDPAQKEKYGGDFIAFFEGVTGIATDRLQALEAELGDTKVDLGDRVATLFETVTPRLEAAADKFNAAANRMDNAVAAFATAAANINIRVDVNSGGGEVG